MPGLIKSSWLKQDSIVIDVGISFIDIDGKSVMSGDVEFNEEAL